MPAHKFYGGRKTRIGTIKETGFDLGGRGHGHSERVTAKIGSKSVTLAEKRFPHAEKVLPRMQADLKARNVFVLNELRKLGLNAVPTARFAIAEGQSWSSGRQIMTDLSKGGKFRVIDYADEGRKLNPEAAKVRNIREIEEQIEKETRTAKSHGFNLMGFEWLIAVDPKTNSGKAFIADVKHTLVSPEQNSRYFEWKKKLREE